MSFRSANAVAIWHDSLRNKWWLLVWFSAGLSAVWFVSFFQQVIYVMHFQLSQPITFPNGLRSINKSAGSFTIAQGVFWTLFIVHSVYNSKIMWPILHEFCRAQPVIWYGDIYHKYARNHFWCCQHFSMIFPQFRQWHYVTMSVNSIYQFIYHFPSLMISKENNIYGYYFVFVCVFAVATNKYIRKSVLFFFPLASCLINSLCHVPYRLSQWKIGVRRGKSIELQLNMSVG